MNIKNKQYEIQNITVHNTWINIKKLVDEQSLNIIWVQIRDRVIDNTGSTSFNTGVLNE